MLHPCRLVVYSGGHVEGQREASCQYVVWLGSVLNVRARNKKGVWGGQTVRGPVVL